MTGSTTATQPVLLDVEDAARMAGTFSKFSLYRAISRGDVPPVSEGGPVVRIGGRVYLNAARWAEYLGVSS